MDFTNSKINRVELFGYKSIKKVDYDFKPGLNIIIGNNGSGKTNLLKFIDKVFKRNYVGLDLFKAKINVSRYLRGLIENYIWVSENKIIEKGNLESLKNQLDLTEPDKAEYFQPTFISYEIPNEIPILANEFIGRIDIKNKRFISSEFQLYVPYSLLLFQIYLKEKIFKDKPELNTINDNLLKQVLDDFFKNNLLDIKNSLLRFTPIQDLRFSDSARVSVIDSDILEFRNIVFEYKINNEWFSWNSLSDGSKRLIYIIFCISPLDITVQFPNKNPLERTKNYEVVLLEEPEIGIHPHQLHLLLTFLKEQSKFQQIIITTHSPQVLDMLDKTELNNIGIAEIDYEKGTTLRHLTEEEINKATYYLENDGMLSDYWRFSDFQRQKNSK